VRIDKCKLKLILERSFDILLDILFPRFCLNCKKEGRYICSDCFLFLSEASFICLVCERRSYFGKSHKYCKGKDQPEGLISAWDCEGIVKDAIYRAKHESVLPPLQETVDIFFMRLEENKERISLFFYFLKKENTSITFVPSCPKKHKKRGLDSAQEIANILSKRTRKETKRLLYREEQTRSQTKLNRGERKENVNGAFKINSEERLPFRVIVVDDVWESGATIRECTKVLKENGVKEVWGFTLAKTP